MFDPESLMDDLNNELHAAIKAMKQAKNMEEKLAYSQIVKNLCESLGVFLNLATEMMGPDYDDD